MAGDRVHSPLPLANAFLAHRKHGAILAPMGPMPDLALPSFSGAVIVANFLFGSVGFVAFIYGKKMHVWKTMFIGLILMGYTYFVESTLLLFGIGTVLTAALFIWRD